MIRSTRGALLAAATVLACLPAAVPALAHVTLEAKQAPAGGSYKAVLRVGHGCDGSATTTLRVTIPEGVTAVKPMPKPGWQLTTKEGQYAEAAPTSDGALAKGVTEIVWSGGSLPDAWYDEFVFRAALPNQPAGTTVYFPVIQECEKGAHHWVAIPKPGEHSHNHHEETAPGVTLTAKP